MAQKNAAGLSPAVVGGVIAVVVLVIGGLLWFAAGRRTALSPAQQDRFRGMMQQGADANKNAMPGTAGGFSEMMRRGAGGAPGAPGMGMPGGAPGMGGPQGSPGMQMPGGGPGMPVMPPR